MDFEYQKGSLGYPAPGLQSSYPPLGLRSSYSALGPLPHKSFNQLNLLLGKVSHYDHVHITFNSLPVI